MEAAALLEFDLDRLARLKALAWLSLAELKLLAAALVVSDFKRHEVLFPRGALTSEAHILLTGVVRFTGLNSRRERITMALLAPGPLPDWTSVQLSHFDFRCEAYENCRVGRVGWNEFEGLAHHSAAAVFRKFHQQDVSHWCHLLLRTSSSLNLGLRERVQAALLELSAEFGIKESRGTLLRVCFSHKDIAELVGASRPRVTEHLAHMEREHLLVRDGRHLIVCEERMREAADSPYAAEPDSALRKLAC